MCKEDLTLKVTGDMGIKTYVMRENSTGKQYIRVSIGEDDKDEPRFIWVEQATGGADRGSVYIAVPEVIAESLRPHLAAGVVPAIYINEETESADRDAETRKSSAADAGSKTAAEESEKQVDRNTDSGEKPAETVSNSPDAADSKIDELLALFKECLEALAKNLGRMPKEQGGRKSANKRHHSDLAAGLAVRLGDLLENIDDVELDDEDGYEDCDCDCDRDCGCIIIIGKESPVSRILHF